MTRMRWCAALGLLLLAACGSRRGPGDMEGLLTPLTVEPPPIYAIIGARGDLALTSAQVAALDSIAMVIQSTNRPLIEELQAVSPAARGGMRLTDEGEPILEEIRANGREATEGVHALLTEDQRSKVCTLFDRSMSQGRRGPGAPPPPADPAASNRPGAGPRWYWCAPAAPADEPGQAASQQ